MYKVKLQTPVDPAKGLWKEEYFAKVSGWKAACLKAEEFVNDFKKCADFGPYRVIIQDINGIEEELAV